MKISSLILSLRSIQIRDGDLDVIHRVGEMNDPEGISGVKVVGADKSGTEASPWYYIPWDADTVTNARVVELE